MRYTSTRLCKMGEYVERTLKGVSLSDCPKLGASGAVAPTSGNVPRGTASGTSSQPNVSPATAATDFEGEWQCTNTNSHGLNSQNWVRITRAVSGNFEINAEGWSQALTGGVVENNTLKFAMSDKDGGVAMSLWRNGEGLAGTTKFNFTLDGTHNNFDYESNCRRGSKARPVDRGIPGGRK